MTEGFLIIIHGYLEVSYCCLLNPVLDFVPSSVSPFISQTNPGLARVWFVGKNLYEQKSMNVKHLFRIHWFYLRGTEKLLVSNFLFAWLTFMMKIDKNC